MDREDEEHDEYVEPPMKVNFWFAIGMLTVMTALAGVTAEFLVESIDGMAQSSGVSREFVGMILLPGKQLPLQTFHFDRRHSRVTSTSPSSSVHVHAWKRS